VTNADRAGDARNALSQLRYPFDDGGSTPGRGPGILVDVHPGLFHCGDGRLATTSIAVMARVDNILELHN
jgi:hypothetical protein